MKKENEIKIKVDERELIESSARTVQNMIGDCVNPTQEDLRKLLAIQGTILNQLGIEMLIESRGVKKNDKKKLLGLKFLSASREALKSAGALKPESDSDSDSGFVD